MLTYNVLATLYLLYLGIRGEWVGILLWPAVVLHAVLILLLARAWFHVSRATSEKPPHAARNEFTVETKNQ
jgi:hypothetical protein